MSTFLPCDIGPGDAYPAGTDECNLFYVATFDYALVRVFSFSKVIAYSFIFTGRGG